MVTITVKFFSIYQEAYGAEELTCSFEESVPVVTVLDQAIAQYPKLKPWREVTRFGVNLNFVEQDYLLQDGDEVVLIPPVSGG